MKDKELTERIIGAAINVHSALGPGFLESVYEEALSIEFADLGIAYERQKSTKILHRGRPVGEHRLDFPVESRVVLNSKRF